MTLITMKRQSGVVLLVSLIILILLTMISITALQVTGLQEKMVSNFNNRNLAFQSSEIALRDTEGWLLGESTAPDASHTRVWDINTISATAAAAGLEWWQETWPVSATVYGGVIPGVNSNPSTMIEYRGFVLDTSTMGVPPSGKHYYVITSRGTGSNDQSVVLLQSTIARE